MHFVEWHGPVTGHVVEGKHVAIKVYRRANGRGGFKEVITEDDLHIEGEPGGLVTTRFPLISARCSWCLPSNLGCCAA